MKPVLRRHPVIALAAGLLVLAAAGVALAPWWIDLAPVRAKIQSAASSALAGTLTYERMDLSWFPRPEVVVHSAKVAVPGIVSGTVRVVRVSPALWPLLRGRVVLTTLRVEGLDLAVTAGPSKAPNAASSQAPGWQQSLSSLGSRTLAVSVGPGRVVVSREGRGSLVLEGLRVDASLRSAEGKALLTLSRLSLDSPRLLLEGSLLADAASSRVDAAAHGSALDVTDVRSKLLSFAGDDPLIAAIFAIFRGGTLKSFSFASSGSAPGELGLLERMTIRAAVEDARVRVPGPNLDLTDVSADVVLERGVLSAEHAEARVGKSRASEGKLLLGLAKGDGRLRVEAQLKADLAEAPAILARVIKSPTFLREMALVQGLRGRAAGRLTIGDSMAEPRTSVDVSEMKFSAAYARMPWPLEVRAGRFFFDGERVGVSAMSGSLGHSTFEGLAARIRLGKRPALESGSGSFDVSLEDFLEGVRTRQESASLAKSVRRLTGSLHVDLRRVSGPLAHLEEASVAASGTFKEILFSSSSSSLPPLSIASGRFTASDDAIRVEDVDARTMDASLRVSGAWNGYRKGAGTIEAMTDGRLGAEAIRWGWTRADLPSEFRPAAPIALRGVRVGFAAGGALSLSGDLVVANGPRLTLDLVQGGGTTEVRNLTVADGETHADMALRRRGNELDLRFKGRLDGATLAKVFGGRTWRGGALEGDLAAHVPLETPARLTADGALTATGFEVPTPAGNILVERLETRAAGNRLDVPSSSLALDEQKISVTGNATLRDGSVVLDMDVSTGDLPWTRVEKILGRVTDAKKRTNAAPAASDSKAAEEPVKTAPGAPLAIGGGLRLSVSSFSYGDFVWKPVNAELTFGTNSVEAKLLKADLCGISTTGEARVLPGGNVALEARVNAQGSDINVPLTCLGVEASRMTGSYEATVQVDGEGAVSELPRLLRGPLTFKAEKGRIGKATVLTRILGVLNATEVFAGKSGTRVGEAIPYDSLTAVGDVADGGVSIQALALKAPSITLATTGTIGLLDPSLDLVVLAHPLSTVDKVVQAVPVVRHILGRDFLAVAVKVTGTLADPKATVTPGRDVGKGLIGILERTVTLPVKVFEPPPEGK